jgi:hypothetical protein
MKEPARLRLQLPMLSGKKVRLYGDDVNGVTFMKELAVKGSGEVVVDVQPNGGFVLVQ